MRSIPKNADHLLLHMPHLCNSEPWSHSRALNPLGQRAGETLRKHRAYGVLLIHLRVHEVLMVGLGIVSKACTKLSVSHAGSTLIQLKCTSQTKFPWNNHC
jgi:hypothetical protein